MAGNFPDVPSNRMSLDKDGSQLFFINGNLVITQLSGTQVQGIVNDSVDAVSPAGSVSGKREYLAVLFPEKRDLKGWYGIFSTLSENAIKTAGTEISRVEVSTNTTNGLDGTWSQVGTLATPSPIEIIPGYRDSINSINALGVKGVRFVVYKNFDLDIHTVHLYGTISAGENPKRVALWHPTLDQQISGAWFDWGNVPRGSSADRQFRVKNMHSSLTAQTIVLGYDTLTDATPSLPAQHLLSSDGSTFSGSLTLSSLSPGAISAVLTARRVTPTNAQLGLWTLRLNAEPTSWV